jgi:hypothetical protein
MVSSPSIGKELAGRASSAADPLISFVLSIFQTAWRYALAVLFFEEIF